MSAPTIPTQQWIWRAQPRHIVDGDTLDVYIDTGWHSYRIERIRLLGVNTSELRGPEREAGVAAKLFVAQWLRDADTDDLIWPLILQSKMSDTFGRYLGTIWRISDGRSLNQDLLDIGHAVPFMV